MPSSGWLAALTRHFSRPPTLPQDYAAHCAGQPGGNGVATVSLQASQNACQSTVPPTRPTTPWSLDTLDDEIQRSQGRPPDHPSKPPIGNGPPSATPRHNTQSSEGDVTDLSTMEGRGGRASHAAQHSSRPASAASRPASAASCPGSTKSRPPSASSRPTSAASHLSTPGHYQGHTTSLPAQVDEAVVQQYVQPDANMEARGHYYIPPVIPPLYDRPLVAPTPTSTRCNTPVWDLDGEKRVRFLEPEVVGDIPSRPPSVNSQYSQILKNSTRFAFQPSQPLMTGEVGGHNPRFCNCPCHFFPSARRSLGIQVKRTDPEPPRPRHYRLYLTPTTRGLDEVTLASKSLSLVTRAVLSQVGLILVVVAWWVAGAAIFSTVEGAAESETVNKMAALRTDLVLGLATELRQVLPYEAVWRTKIETYMERLETAVLDAARAGYASRAPTWTMAGALLYSASLTTLVGPSGMTLRTGFSRIFAVLFSLIGAPLVLLLTISGALTIREGVGKAWAWRCGFGKQGKVADGRGHVVEGRAGQYGSGRGGSAVSTLNLASRPQSSTSASAGVGGMEHGAGVTPNGPGELPGSIGPPSGARPQPSGRALDIQQQARVPALDSTLGSSSALSSTPRDTDESSASSGASNSMAGGALNSSQYRTTRGEQPYGGVNPVMQRRSKLGYPPYPRQASRRGQVAPWSVYLAILVVYIVLGLAIFAPIQRWSLPSSLYILMSTLLTLDHDSLGEKELLGSSKIIVPYVLYMLVGLVLVATLVISVWSNLCASLVNTGKYLAVVRPAAR